VNDSLTNMYNLVLTVKQCQTEHMLS